MRKLILMLLITSGLLCQENLYAQEETPGWSLEAMINYALEYNLQVKQSELNAKTYEANLEQARANRWADLSASGQQSFTAGTSIDRVTSDYVAENSNSTNLSLSSQITLFNGYQVRNNIKENNLQVEVGQLAVKEAKNDIVVALTQAYLQGLYYLEAVKTAEETLNASEKQAETTLQLYEAGSASAKELAQLRSQAATDMSSLVSAQNQYNFQILTLKQLLELGLEDDFDIVIPLIGDDLQFDVTPKKEAYENALIWLPQLKAERLRIGIADYQYKQARAGYLPTLSLGASVGTGYTSITNESYASQFDHNLNERLSLSLSIPIWDKKATSTNVQKALINKKSASLEVVATEKEILRSIETTYQDLTASINQMAAARLQVEASEESYKLSEQQFNLGMLNTTDFIIEKTTYLNAQQAFLQAKYNAVLNYQLYQFYQGKSIKL